MPSTTTAPSESTPTPSSSHHHNRGGRARGRGRGLNGNRGRGRGRGDEGIATANNDATAGTADPAADNTHTQSRGQRAGGQDQQKQTSRRRNNNFGNARKCRGGGTDAGVVRNRKSKGGHGAGEEGEDDGPQCVVCAEELAYFAVGECNHPGRCATCAMRSRVLLKDRSCPECKTLLDRLVVAELPPNGVAPRFESFNLWGDFAGPDSSFDDASGMIFSYCQSHHAYLSRAVGLYCPVEGCPRTEQGNGAFQSKAALQAHMKDIHQRFFCNVCLNNRPLFVSEQEVFSAAALRKHEARVDGHPLCRFCSERYFDNTALYDHMNGTHINCHLCPQENQHRYFRGEPQLRDHLRTAHFLCDRAECRQSGVVSAFNTPQELQDHLLTEHGIAGRRHAVGFNVRRASRDGAGRASNVAEDGTGSGYGDGGGAGFYSSVAPRELFSAPDPDQELADGIVFPVPSNRERDSGVPGSPDPFVPAGAYGENGNTFFAGSDSGRALGGGSTGGAVAGGRGGGWGWGGSGSPPRQEEAFPSLPTPPPRAEERHEFSLVGRPKPPRIDRGAAGAASEKSAGGAAAGGASYQEEEDRKRLLMRNKRVAEALGIRAALGAGATIGGAQVRTTADGSAFAFGLGDGLDAIRDHLTRTNYSTYLVTWARANRSELLKLERRLSDLVTDRKATSTQFKPMPADNRRIIHELGVHYGLVTQSYDLEPKRYVSAIKQKLCRIPDRLLSVAVGDPNYKGTDEALPDAASSAAIEPFVPNYRATALQQAGAPSLTAVTALSEKLGAPRTSTVTSISSSNPPLLPAAIPASTPAQTALAKRNRRYQPTLAVTAVTTVSPTSQRQDTANSTSTRSSAAVAAPPGPPAETMLILHSVQAGLRRDTVLERIKTIVPARTVVRVRPATSLEAAAEGVGQTGGPLVVEFTNELNARRAWGKIEQDAEQLVAAARVTRTDYHAPFRARLYSAASPKVSTRAQGSADSGREVGGGDSDEVRDNWDSSGDEKEEEEQGAGMMSAESDDAEGMQQEMLSDLVPSEAVAAIRMAEPGTNLGDGEGSGTERNCGPTGEMENGRENGESAGNDVDAGEERGTSLDREMGGAKRGEDGHEVVRTSEEATADQWDGIQEGGGASGRRSASLRRRAEEGLKKQDAPDKDDPCAGDRGTSAPASRRQSKWGNSVIKGRLSRPSDGRATTVEQEAKERQEKIEKLRRLEEERRETRRQRDQAKRAERVDTGRLDSHAFLWENLGDPSSSESEDDGDVGQATDDIDKRTASRAGPQSESISKGRELDRVNRVPPVAQENGHVGVTKGIGRDQHQSVKGWACDTCTFWNDVSCEDGDEQLQCSMCDAEGPKNAGLPWVRARSK